MKYVIISFGFLLLFACSDSSGITTTDAKKYRLFVEKHLQAVDQKNLDYYLSTISPNIIMITPDGTYMDSFEEVKAFHEKLFENEYKFNFKLIKENITNALAYSVYDIDLEYPDEHGHMVHQLFHLSLTFEKVNDKWMLIHDQCTNMFKENK
jgi:ketosteroid isomerase-like protein